MYWNVSTFQHLRGVILVIFGFCKGGNAHTSYSFTRRRKKKKKKAPLFSTSFVLPELVSALVLSTTRTTSKTFHYSTKKKRSENNTMGPCLSLLGINNRGGANTPASGSSSSTSNAKKSNKSSNSNEPTQEELEREERAAAAQLYAEKEKLLEKAKKAFQDGGHRGPGNILEQLDKEAGRQQADLAMLEEAAIRQQKLQKRREAKRKAEAEQKWMVFSNLDAFDEGDMTKLAGFMEIVLKHVPKLGDSQWTDKEVPGENDSGLNIIEEYLALKAESTNRLKRMDSMDNIPTELEKTSSFNEGR